jgi:hypothetical protein
MSKLNKIYLDVNFGYHFEPFMQIEQQYFIKLYRAYMYKYIVIFVPRLLKYVGSLKYTCSFYLFIYVLFLSFFFNSFFLPSFFPFFRFLPFFISFFFPSFVPSFLLVTLFFHLFFPSFLSFIPLFLSFFLWTHKMGA